MSNSEKKTDERWVACLDLTHEGKYACTHCSTPMIQLSVESPHRVDAGPFVESETGVVHTEARCLRVQMRAKTADVQRLTESEAALAVQVEARDGSFADIHAECDRAGVRRENVAGVASPATDRVRWLASDLRDARSVTSSILQLISITCDEAEVPASKDEAVRLKSLVDALRAARAGCDDSVRRFHDEVQAECDAAGITESAKTINRVSWMRGRLDDARAEEVRLRTELAAALSTIASLTKSRDHLQVGLNQAHRECDQANVDGCGWDLVSRVRRLRERCDELRAERDRAVSDMNAHRERLNEIAFERVEEAKKVAGLRSELEEARSVANERAWSKIEANVSTREVAAERDQLCADLSTANAALKVANEAIDVLTRDRNLAINMLARVEAQCDHAFKIVGENGLAAAGASDPTDMRVAFLGEACRVAYMERDAANQAFSRVEAACDGAFESATSDVAERVSLLSAAWRTVRDERDVALSERGEAIKERDAHDRALSEIKKVLASLFGYMGEAHTLDYENANALDYARAVRGVFDRFAAGDRRVGEKLREMTIARDKLLVDRDEANRAYRQAKSERDVAREQYEAAITARDEAQHSVRLLGAGLETRTRERDEAINERDAARARINEACDEVAKAIHNVCDEACVAMSSESGLAASAQQRVIWLATARRRAADSATAAYKVRNEALKKCVEEAAEFRRVERAQGVQLMKDTFADIHSVCDAAGIAKNAPDSPAASASVRVKWLAKELGLEQDRACGYVRQRDTAIKEREVAVKQRAEACAERDEMRTRLNVVRDESADAMAAEAKNAAWALAAKADVDQTRLVAPEPGSAPAQWGWWTWSTGSTGGTVVSLKVGPAGHRVELTAEQALEIVRTAPKFAGPWEKDLGIGWYRRRVPAVGGTSARIASVVRGRMNDHLVLWDVENKDGAIPSKITDFEVGRNAVDAHLVSKGWVFVSAEAQDSGR